MKIALIGPSIAQRGGIASVLQGLHVWLGKHDVDVVLIPTTTGGNHLARFTVFARAWLSTLLLCIARNCDLVHLHVASRGSFLRKAILAITCLIFRIPYVIHLHGGKFHEFYSDGLTPTSRAFVRFIFLRASRIIALSEAWKQWIESELAVRNVVVVFNGVDFTVPDSEIGQPRKTILFLGRLEKEKGVDDLISAMGTLRKHLPNAVLELGGDGDLDFYKRLTAGSDHIRFRGWLDEVGRSAALTRAAVFCLPSWHEGLPMSILEAMGAGLPVISTKVGGIPEVVEDGVTGLLISPGDTSALTEALYVLLSNPDLATAMGRRGRKRQLERFSLDAMGRMCVEVYASCLRRL